MPHTVFRCTECGNLVAVKERPERCLNCRRAESGITEYALFEEYTIGT